MTNIALVEGLRSAPMTITLRGQKVALPDPSEHHFQVILLWLSVGSLPELDSVPSGRANPIFDAWCANYDLPDFQSSQRLAYLIDHYRSALVYDLRTICGIDLSAYWNARRWRTLLDLIDHLPPHSWYSGGVAMDEEHARMLADSLAARSASGEADAESGPSVVGWTPEMGMLADILDALRSLEHSTIAVQVGQKAGPPPKPSRRPTTALSQAIVAADRRRRKAAHEELVARVLPNKGRAADPVD